MLNKNDIITSEILDISSDGNGVAKYEGLTVFVPMTAVGDVCEIKILKILSSYCFGKLERLLTPSPDRVEPICDIFSRCGGCDFLHMNYEAELLSKQNFVKAAFQRIGKFDCEVQKTLFCRGELHYRNKAQFPVAQDSSGNAVTGFFAQRSHTIIPCQGCLLQPDLMTEIALYTVETMNNMKIKAYDENSHKGIIRHIYMRYGVVSKELMVCLVATKDNFFGMEELCKKLIDKFSEITTLLININNKNTNIILGEENRIIYGNGTIKDTLCGVEIELSPHSFYQVNHDGAQELYTIAKEALQLNKSDILLDMYCGAGAIGLSMASSVKALVGVEVVPQAVENAIKNAQKHNANNTRFICADAKDAAAQLLCEGFLPSAVVVDPPRKGCDEDTLSAIIKMNPKKIAMI
ncbi:MAG: 23S rRNA (uracil(1939)-C(5))-methyltransferase RlmD, partial [Oscillospiraceae bacterium]